MIQTFDQALSNTGIYGNRQDKILIQERINGIEYVVNTVSCNGIHKVTSIWKYHKITTREGGQVYDTMQTVYELNLGESEMVEYAYDVADAMGIKYGPVHGEYMLDENGPVLIEVNCRPCGGGMEARYLDQIFGQHETDSSLDSYLNPKKFHQERFKGYRPFGYGALKLFITPKDLIAQSAPIRHISNKLKSHYKTKITPITEGTIFEKTQDMETTSGITYLVNSNHYQLHKDIEFLRNLERNAFQLVLSEGLNKELIFDENEIHKNLKSFIDEIEALGTCLLISDTIYDDLNIIQAIPKELNEIKRKFDAVIVNLNKSLSIYNDDRITNFILNTFDRIKEGGLIIIPESTYEFLPNGRIGAEALIKTLDLKIELSLHQFPKMLIASKGKE